MKTKNILIGCDDLIIGTIQSLALTYKLYEDFFPIMSGGRVIFDREKLAESQAFNKGIVGPSYQNKVLKIIITTIDSDDPSLNEEIIYPNILLIKNDHYIYSIKDYLIIDELHFAITGSE